MIVLPLTGHQDGVGTSWVALRGAPLPFFYFKINHLRHLSFTKNALADANIWLLPCRMLGYGYWCRGSDWLVFLKE